MTGVVGVSGCAGAGHRWPTPHPGALRASPRTPSARRGEGRAIHAPSGAPQRASSAPGQATAPQAKPDHPAAGIAAPRQTRARPDNPPRAQPDDAAGKAARDLRAWSTPHAPSDGDDGLARSERHSRGSGNSGPDGAALAAGRGESSASGHRSPPSARCDRGASPPGSRRTPGAGTFPRTRARRHRARSGPAGPDRLRCVQEWA
jgi:hypothetical protein